MVNIKGYDKARVLKALYNGSKPMGMGVLQAKPGEMTDEQAREMIEVGDDPTRMFGRHSHNTLYFDYVYGRPLKSDLSGDEFDPSLYDRDNGNGSAQRVIEAEFSENERVTVA